MVQLISFPRWCLMSRSFPYDWPCDGSRTYATPLTTPFTSTPLRPPLSPTDDFSLNAYFQPYPRSTTCRNRPLHFHQEGFLPMVSPTGWSMDCWTQLRMKFGTWRSIESFLATLRLTDQDQTSRHVANQWRHYYEVPALHRSVPLHDMTPVLPQPRHSNISFGQPVSVILDHTAIFQTCWGRSAFRHSQGDLSSSLAFWLSGATPPDTSCLRTSSSTSFPPTSPLNHLSPTTLARQPSTLGMEICFFDSSL